MIDLAILFFLGLYLLISIGVVWLVMRWADMHGRSRWRWGLIAAFCIFCHEIIITHVLAGWFCLSGPHPKTFVLRKVDKPGSIYFEDNVYPGYDERDRLNTIANYLDGVDVTTLALNDPEGKVHVYTAGKDAWQKSDARATRKDNLYVKLLNEETKAIAKREAVYTKETMPKMNYTVLFNPVPLPGFWLRYLWSDEITITDNATGETIAYNRRLIRRLGFESNLLYTTGSFGEAICGEGAYQRFDLKVFPDNVKMNAPKHLMFVMPEPGFQSPK